MDRPTNRLADATSPYLLQHAHNPVDWYPWGDEAFAAARQRDVPVFLSVGYAACHWCHVMERESFEDGATAAFLNERFVSIKVDREERPDIDSIYMDAVQAMTGAGGWPMSVFLTADGRPFYAGTYFPDESRYGMPSFRQVLEGLSDAWRTRRDEVEGQGSKIAAALARSIGAQAEAEAAAVDEDAAFDQLAASFDREWGGFGRAPKFPHPSALEWLLRQHLRGRADALEIATLTLDRMAAGGIQDHVGGGFARYSVDREWHVPHFEKMLYDNAQLLQLYSHAWLVTRLDRYRTVAERIATYLLRDLRLPDGGFAASQDADSEGIEGRYYVWDYDELTQIVGPAVADALGATVDGNWEGTNVLWRPRPQEDVAAQHGMRVEELEQRVDEARAALLAARTRRVAPSTDDKVITAWNGLAIRGLSIAAWALDDQALLEAATACADFVWTAAHGGDRLLRTWRAGRASPVKGFLDDHALLGLGLLSLYEASGDPHWFERARLLGDRILSLFVGDDGLLYRTGSDAETPMVRPRELQDADVPAGTAAAGELLARLALFTGVGAYRDAASGALRAVGDLPSRAPTAFGSSLGLADLLSGPAREVAIVGDVSSPDTDALMREVLSARYLPNVVLAVGQEERVPLLDGRTTVHGDATAYVCEQFSCLLPVTSADGLAEQLDALTVTARR